MAATWTPRTNAKSSTDSTSRIMHGLHPPLGCAARPRMPESFGVGETEDTRCAAPERERLGVAMVKCGGRLLTWYWFGCAVWMRAMVGIWVACDNVLTSGDVARSGGNARCGGNLEKMGVCPWYLSIKWGHFLKNWIGRYQVRTRLSPITVQMLLKLYNYRDNNVFVSRCSS